MQILSSLILITLLVQFISLLLGRTGAGYLACGLVGYCGKKGADPQKLIILGLFNETRGKQSTGIAVGDKVWKKSGYDGEFSRYVQNYKFPDTRGRNRNVIIHTRKSSKGRVTDDNAHPFIFNYPETSSPGFVGAHNGTVYNWEEMLEKREINPNGVEVDSRGLLYCIFHDKGFKALSEYQGGAALLFHFLEAPNKLYAWRGASGGVEERPLFIWQQHDNNGEVMGAYFSSMKEPLMIISNGDTDNIRSLKANELLVVDKGVIVDSMIISRQPYKSNRSETTINKAPKTTTSTRSVIPVSTAPKANGPTNFPSAVKGLENLNGVDVWDTEPAETTDSHQEEGGGFNAKKGKDGIIRKSRPHQFEFILQEMEHGYTDKQTCYFHMLRYWKNRTLMQGPAIINVATGDIICSMGINSEKDLVNKFMELLKYYKKEYLFARWFFNGVAYKRKEDYELARIKDDCLNPYGQSFVNAIYDGMDGVASAITVTTNQIELMGFQFFTEDGPIKGGTPRVMFSSPLSPFNYEVSSDKVRIVSQKLPLDPNIALKKFVPESKKATKYDSSILDFNLSVLFDEAVMCLVDFYELAKGNEVLTPILDEVYEFIDDVLDIKPNSKEGYLEIPDEQIDFLHAFTESEHIAL